MSHDHNHDHEERELITLVDEQGNETLFEILLTIDGKEEFGKKLKEARLISCLTQENVEEKLIVSRQTISNWETEKFYPDILYVLQLSDLYQVSLNN